VRGSSCAALGSDIVAELDAARTAGMQTALLTQPENSPVEDRHDHPPISSFSEIEVIKEPRTK
jgi:methionine salvage enolase-phosphatase E1